MPTNVVRSTPLTEEEAWEKWMSEPQIIFRSSLSVEEIKKEVRRYWGVIFRFCPDLAKDKVACSRLIQDALDREGFTLYELNQLVTLQSTINNNNRR